MPYANCQKTKESRTEIMFSFLVTFLLASSFALSQRAIQHLPTPLRSDHYVKFAPNDHSIWFSNNGDQSYNPYPAVRNDYGWKWLRGIEKNIGFSTGLVWDGYVSGALRSGGSTSRHGLIGGKILSGVVQSDSGDPAVRIYHIHRNDTLSGHNPDYTMWPQQDGAPVNERGDPFFLGDEQLWFVSNDLDTSRVKNLYGSLPIGMEVQTTVWAFNGGFLKDAVFVKHLLINKGYDTLKDAYIGLWSDMTLGYTYDDYSGVDTLLRLGYQYSAASKDNDFGVPPSAGHLLLQTPTRRSGSDSVIFNGERRKGFAYQPLTGFSWFCCGNAVYQEPELGNMNGTEQLYNILRGYRWNGSPHVDPTTGGITNFVQAGDPIKNLGWIDGIVAGPRWMLTITGTGPFTLAVGDTQEVVYAYLARQGSDRLNSLDKLKEYAGVIKTFYEQRKYLHSEPKTSVRITYPSMNSVSLRLDVIDSNAVQGKVVLLSRMDSLIAEIPLFDDGLHGDGSAGDHHYGATWTTSAMRNGVDVFFDMVDPARFTYRLLGKRRVALAGNVKIVSAYVESDHLNQDHEANPGENCRITLALKNETPFPVPHLKAYLKDGTIPLDDRCVVSDSIRSGQVYRMPYNNDENTFVTIDIPASMKANDSLLVRFRLEEPDEKYNRWEDSVYIPIKEYLKRSTDSLLTHIAGECTGTLGMRMFNPLDWKDHAYRVTIDYDDSTGGCFQGLHLYDLYLRKEVAVFQARLTPYAHDYTMIDGFRITQGTTTVRCVYYLREFNEWFGESGKNLSANYFPPENDWLTATQYFESWTQAYFFFSSKLTPFQLRPVKIQFSSSLDQKAYVYLRGDTPNYAYKGFVNVPLRAYDISDSLNPRQLNVAFVEQSGSAAHDMQWMPTMSASDREYLVIFKSTYKPEADSFYTKRRLQPNAKEMDIQYIGWFVRKSPDAKFKEGDIIFIRPSVPVSWRDTFLINPKGKITSVKKTEIPLRVSLSQNFPNPFHDQTSISFSLPQRAHVRLKIFDAFGREVRTLVDEVREAGEQVVGFDVNRPTLSLPSGVYFYQLEVEGRKLMKKMLKVDFTHFK